MFHSAGIYLNEHELCHWLIFCAALGWQIKHPEMTEKKAAGMGYDDCGEIQYLAEFAGQNQYQKEGR